MNVLQYAFEEGRDTNITWANSDALKQAHLLELHHNNLLNIKLHKGKCRKLAQIHPATGRVVNVFENAFSAARWVTESRRKRSHLTLHVYYQTSRSEEQHV